MFFACGDIHLGWVEPASPIGLTGSSLHGDASWIGSTPRLPVPVSLYLLALQLKPGLLGLRAPEHPLLTPSSLALTQETQEIGV